MSWTAGLRSQEEASFRRTIALPFVTHLIEGSLSPELFRRYLAQDTLYLSVYSRVLAHIASRLEDRELRRTVLSFALDGIAAEEDMHSVFLSDTDMVGLTPGEACRAYTSFLQSLADGPVEAEMGGTLPCFVIYQRVAEHILSAYSPDGHPFRCWIETYADEQFVRTARRAEWVCDTLAEKASPAVCREMTRAWKCATEMEEHFWASASLPD